MNDREFRLRRRIDQLTDERDQARAQVAEWRQRGVKWRRRIYQLTKQLELRRLREKTKR